jgi:DNA-binding CsgD family transcriptional regulator
MLPMNENDYKKVLSFVNDISSSETNLEKSVLNLFEYYFGFERSNFWIFDENHNVTDSISLNIDRFIIDDYLTNYYDMDILTPKGVSPNIDKQNVFHNIDLISNQQYEKSEFYIRFMSKYQFYYDLGVFLFDGTKLWGIIDFVRSKEEKPFTRMECNSLEIIGRFITQKLRENHLILNGSTNFSDSKKMNSLQFLTQKEKEVLELAKRGYANWEIASELYISVNTVKKHMQQLYRKFNVNNRTSLCHKVYS